MYKFTISAPGRVFLSGDPMRYNKLCIAASLDQRTKLIFSLTPKAQNEGHIEINFTSIRLYARIPLSATESFFELGCNNQLTEANLRNLVRNFVDQLSREVFGRSDNYDCNDRAHLLSLQAFFLLLILVSRGDQIWVYTQSSWSVKISTKLPIGGGLGGSASFATCLAACFYRWLFRKDVFNQRDLSRIRYYVQKCERIIFKSPTRLIDSVISVYGSIYVFENAWPTNERLRYYNIERIGKGIPGMKIALVYSNVHKLISEQNKQMESMKQSFPFIKSIQSNIDNVVNKIKVTLDDTELMIGQRDLLKVQKLDYLKDGYVQLAVNFILQTSILSIYSENFIHLLTYTLQKLIRMNQELLRALGMSHPNLDVICNVITPLLSISFAGKLANNGGGGYAFILLSPDSPDAHIDPIVNAYKLHNFTAEITKLNCKGVRNEPTL
ncbi:mevalonate kinase-like [Temnothorax curvispinosus]|uniref:Mevalonate kinase-like n=1 Tax=Temnothorax curvispinosus TaxID=300111 RepID=A0A6J1Q117_9HYME|nr:mevalonate kinase-like [Temnothorax curvispinosus]